jgi:polar amino acid transport system substrate-binding protein
MNKIFVVLACLLSQLSVNAQEVSIHVDDNYRPYSYKNATGKAAGVYIEVLEAVFQKMEGFTVKLIPVPWSRGKALMEKGKVLAWRLHFFMGMTGLICTLIHCIF